MVDIFDFAREQMRRPITLEEKTNKTPEARLCINGGKAEAREKFVAALLELAEVPEVVAIFRKHGISFFYEQPIEEE